MSAALYEFIYPYTLHPLWEYFTIPSRLNTPTPPTSPRAIVNSERPCDALIVEVTGMSAEYAKPPVNPIKWSELPVVWRELAICFQDLSRRRSKVLLARAGRHL